MHRLQFQTKKNPTEENEFKASCTKLMQRLKSEKQKKAHNERVSKSYYLLVTKVARYNQDLSSLSLSLSIRCLMYSGIVRLVSAAFVWM